MRKLLRNVFTVIAASLAIASALLFMIFAVKLLLHIGVYDQIMNKVYVAVEAVLMLLLCVFLAGCGAVGVFSVINREINEKHPAVLVFAFCAYAIADSVCRMIFGTENADHYIILIFAVLGAQLSLLSVIGMRVGWKINLTSSVFALLVAITMACIMTGVGKAAAIVLSVSTFITVAYFSLNLIKDKTPKPAKEDVLHF